MDSPKSSKLMESSIECSIEANTNQWESQQASAIWYPYKSIFYVILERINSLSIIYIKI